MPQSRPVPGLLSGPRRPRNRRRNPLWRFRRFLLLGALFGLSAVLAGVAVLAQEDLPEDDFGELAQTSYICTAEVVSDCNADVATVQLSGAENRVIVAYESIPLVLINAVVAAEDQDYFTHNGLDPVGIARALYQDIQEGRAAQGGSTITQQYVKNAFAAEADRSLVTKLKEATLAVKLEQELTKEEILGRYLNRIYFGRGAYGIEAASQTYFGKNAAGLDLAESAYLAGLIRAPSSADAAKDPEEATRRRASVLARMVADGYVTEAEAEAANGRDWSTLQPLGDREGLGNVTGSLWGTEYFAEAVRQQLVALEPEIGELYTGGLRVYTTLDLDLQRAAFETAAEVVDPRRDPNDPAASIVAVDNRGRVVAMMGGYDFASSQVNLAMGTSGGGSGRQPGSSFKTFALAEAIDQGLSARSLYAAPSVIEIPGADNGNTWRVRGGGSPDGYRDLLDALRGSSNVVYAQLMVDLRPDTVVQMANELGVSATLEPVNALVLGSGEVSVLDMAVAYSTIANQGVRHRPVLIDRIENAEGEVICWNPVDGRCGESQGQAGEAVLDPAIARQVTYALSQVVEAGTGRAAAFGGPAAGKTGTTQDARDAWFVGFSCDVTAAVWMGYPGAPGAPVQTMEDFRGIEVHGGDFPAEMWAAFMARATDIRGGPSCTALATQADFPGKVLNTDLSTTTLPECVVPLPVPEGQDAATGDGLTTTTVVADTTTTEPCQPPSTVLDDPDQSTVPSTTEPSTTEPSTTEPSTTEPSTTEPSTTEQPATTPSTAAPTTTSDPPDDEDDDD